MRTIVIWVFLVIGLNTSIVAQDIVWAKIKNMNTGMYSTGIASDSQGNMYDFGTNFGPGGSYITKYDSNGNVLLNKIWPGNFTLRILKLDNTNRLFFTGSFQGALVLDGIAIQSRGERDVVIGEINQTGNIINVKTFGGGKDDFSYGLAIDNGLEKLLITGGVTDSVYIDNVLTPRVNNAMFIASYTKTLVFSGIQYFDFVPEMNDPYSQNRGQEIVLDNAGNKYVLHFREGNNPMSDPPYIYPLSGMYLMKINSSGTIVWHQRIIGGESYYGWDAGRLRLNAIGDAFILKSSSGKYGGTGTVLRLSSNTGATTWTYSENPDNTYYDIQIDNSDALILVGNENEIPYGETSRYGNDILKKFDQNNNVVWEKRLYDIRSSYLTLDNQQNLFLTGILRKETVMLGKEVLNTSDDAGFLAKVINQGAVPLIATGTINGSPFNPGASVNVPYNVSTPFSAGNIFTAQLSDPFGNFKYAVNIGTFSAVNSGTINAIIPGSTGPGSHYRIRVTGANPLRHGSDKGTDLIIDGAQTLIASNASWKYLDNGTDQGTAWRSASLSDAAWKTGNTQLGYGDGDEATIVSYGGNAAAKYITTYFRKTINISNPAQYSSFTLSLLKDDGAVVYINGVEALKSNMPAGTVSYTTFASSALDGAAESNFTDFTISPSKFINGNNLVAVEIHQSSRSSSDISFNLKLTGNKAAPSNEIIAANSSWKYLDNGTNFGYDGFWTGYSYTETGWKTGNAELGYGDGDEATVVSYGPSAANKYITTYFTKKFNVDASEISGLEMELIRDDGAIVFLNNSFVFRNNMPSYSAGASTLATTYIDGTNEKTWIKAPIDVNALVNGENIIGVEIHQHSASSSDISFNLKLRSVTPVPSPLVCTGTGTILREYWANVSGDQVAQIPVTTAPSSTGELSVFEGPTNIADNYGARISGYICPPFTGKYTFWIASDDDAELWLSSNADPANKFKIADVTGWTAAREWEKYPSQQSIMIDLIAGTEYYIEALHKEATGGDNIAVGWQMPTGTFERPIPGNRLSPFEFIPPAPTVELISAGSSWKYLDNGSNQGTAWRETAFSDATWKSGNAELGYGDGGEATVVSYGTSSTNKYITTYFRKTFNVIDKSTVSGLELSLIRDDGAAVYINGVEVYRNNLPSGTIYYNTLAPTYIDGVNEYTYVIANLSSSALVDGNNIIAVEIHQNARTSSDISFNFKLKTLSGSRILDISNTNDSIQQNSIPDNTVEMIVYPNPNTGKFNLEFCIDDLEDKAVLIEITNAFGQVVYNKIPQKINGCINETIELESNIPTGIYILKVSIDGKIQTAKMLLTR